MNTRNDLYHLEHYLDMIGPAPMAYYLDRLLDCYIRHNRECPQEDFDLVYEETYALKTVFQKMAATWK